MIFDVLCVSLLVFGVERVRINVSLSRELVKWLDEQVRRNPGLFHSRSHAVELLLRLAIQHIHELPILSLREPETTTFDLEAREPVEVSRRVPETFMLDPEFRRLRGVSRPRSRRRD